MGGDNWSFSKIDEMIGQTFNAVERSEHDEHLLFRAEDVHFKFMHRQEGDETVVLESVCGNLSDLVGVPILMASEWTTSNRDNPFRTHTRTSYKFGTVKGSVLVQWLGTSDGQDSEEVSLLRFPKNRRTTH